MRLTRTSYVSGVLFLFALCGVATPLRAQDFVSVFNGKDLSGWKAEHKKVEVRDGVIRVRSGNGWLRTERVLADFVLRVDVRVTGKKTSAGLFIRSWPVFTQKRLPTSGYELRLALGEESPTADGWKRLEIECIGNIVRVRLNGAVMFTSDTVQVGEGHLALWSKDGTAEFRELHLKELPSLPDDANGVYRVVNGVTSPRVIKRGQPRYTAAALQERVKGKVVLTGIVMPDGTVGDIRILRSLDQVYGLDYQAIDSVRAWRFEPGTLDGKPVPVRILIELDFNLK